MERKTTKLKYLLLIPALFLSICVLAQQAEPVKQAPVKKTVGENQAASKYRPNSWQLEEALQGVLDAKGTDLPSPRPAPKSNNDNPQLLQGNETKSAVLNKDPHPTPEQKVQMQEKLQALDRKHDPNFKGIDVPSFEAAPASRYVTPSTWTNAPNSKFPSTQAYAYSLVDPTLTYPNGPIRFNLNNPANPTSIANTSTLANLYSSSWANGEWYAGGALFSGGYGFYKINPVTGARTTINASVGFQINGLAYDWTTNTMYAIGYSTYTNLYRINLTTGVATLVGNTGGTYLGINLGCDQFGQLYMIDIAADVLCKINKTNAAVTVLGPIGFNANYAQDMEFDNSDNTMYAATYNYNASTGIGQGELRSVNLQTGATTIVGYFPGNMEVGGFAIPNQPFTVYDNDLGITNLIAPVSSGILNNAEPVTVTIKNFGNIAQQNFFVKYTLNGGTPVTEVCTLNILPGTSQDYTFTTPGNFSAYLNHELVVCTDLIGDEQPINDCKTYFVLKIMPTMTDTLRPKNLPYWTGTTDGSSFIQNSQIQITSGDIQGGYAKFDISTIPDQTQVSGVKVGYYVSYQSGAPFMQIKRLIADPMASSAFTVFNEIKGNAFYINTTSGYSVGWHVFDLPQNSWTDLSQATLQDFFALGFYEYETCFGCYTATIEGWNQPHIPYLVVTYGFVPQPNDLAITALVAPVSGPGLQANQPITVTVKNVGTSAQQNFPIKFTLDGGATITENCPLNLLPGTSQNFTFFNTGDFSALGNHHLVVCTALPTDQFTSNDCKSFTILKPWPSITDTIYPKSLPYWTGTTNGTNFTQNSLINFTSGNVDGGWAKFDLTGIPDNGIVSAKIGYYVNFQSGSPYFNIQKVNGDPLTGSPASVFSDIQTGTFYLPCDYTTTPAGYAVGWHVFDLPAVAVSDITAALPQDWFAVGFWERETSVGSYYGSIDGWGQANKPYLVLTYYFDPLPNDLKVSSLISPVSSTSLGSTETITVKIENLGLNNQSNFPVSFTLDGGSTVTENCPLMIPSLSSQNFTFIATGNFSAGGLHNLVVCTGLTTDQDPSNDCKSFIVEKSLLEIDTIYPMSLPYWTGSTNGTTFTQNSLINFISGNVEGGWAKFNLGTISASSITAAKIGYNMISQSGLPYHNITKLTSDPMTGTPASVFTQIQTGTIYLSQNGSSTPPSYQLGWQVRDLPATAIIDLYAALSQGWFAVGFHEYEASVGSYYASVNGWAQTDKPYLVISYYPPFAIDGGVTAITAPVTAGALSATEPVTVTLKNFGSDPLTSIPVVVTITGPTGPQTLPGTYTNAGGLAPNAVATYTLPVTADLSIFGAYTIEACADITGDPMYLNDCKSVTINNLCPLAILNATSPTTGYGLGYTVPVTVNIKNVGTTPLSNVVLQYTMNGGAPFSETFAGPLAPDATVPFTFSQTVDLHAFGTYIFEVCPIIPGQPLPNNGCLSFTVTHTNIVNDTFYPQNIAYWTGSTNGTTYTQNSLINFVSGAVENGWAKFDISDMVMGGTINSLKVNLFTFSQSGIPFAYVKRMALDPTNPSVTPAQVMNEIITGPNYVTASSIYNLGWHSYELGATAITNFTSQIPSDWFAISIYEYESSVGSYYGTINGWAQTERPYLSITYTMPFDHDVSVVSIDTDPYVAVGPYIPKATVKNLGTNVETFNVTMTGTDGYSSTKPVSNLAVNATYQVFFDSWNAPLGPVTLTACTQLGNDVSAGNNCKSKSLNVEAKLTKVYAYNAYDPSGVLPEGPVTFFLQHPNVITSLAPTVSGDFLSGGCWVQGTWYGAEYNNVSGSNLWTINHLTGAMTLIGPMGYNVSGMTYDHTTGTLWAVSAVSDALGIWYTSIYTVNMATGAMTLVRDAGPIGLAINLACNQQGMLFFAELSNNRLWAYDPLMDELELMGPLGVALNYAQDAEFDKADNILYFAGYSSTGTLFRANLATGALTSLGTFQGGAELTCFAIPYQWQPAVVDLGAMWLTNPITGNLTSAEPVMLRVRNYGQTTVTDVDLCFEFNGATVCDNWGIWGYPPIEPTIYFDYAFIPTIDLSAPGDHCLEAYIFNVLPLSDNNQYNDTVAKCVTNSACGLITVFPNAIPEAEPCGENMNGGCYSTPNAFVNLVNGNAYSGTLWKVDDTRDTDWYKFTLTATKGIRIIARSEFNMDIILVKLPCSSQEVVITKLINKCSTDSIVIDALTPGEYAFIFAHTFVGVNTTCANNSKYSFEYLIRPPKYCVANTSYCREYISKVQVNSTIPFSNSSNCTAGGYKDYTNMSFTLEAGGTYTITVTNGYGQLADQCGIWIDWDQDFTFDQANEKLVVTPTTGMGPYTATFTVPIDAPFGPTRMRARITNTGVVSPCGTTYYGEVEDYTVNVHIIFPDIITTAGSLDEPCPGPNKVVPITVQEFTNVDNFNLSLARPSGVTLLGFQNVNPALAQGNISVYQLGNTIYMNWIADAPVTIGTGTLLELLLETSTGSDTLFWDETNSYYGNIQTGVFPDQYVYGVLTFGNCSDVGGMVKYKNLLQPPLWLPNSSSTLIDSTIVYLYQGSTIAYQQTIDNTGHYLFPNCAKGTYTLKASSTKKWGGGNATDALFILRHFVGLAPLTGLNLTCANVNQDAGVNALDALMISQRFVGSLASFAPNPDWYFQQFTIVVNGTANQTQEIRGLCAGDVNGSYVPLNTINEKVYPTVFLRNEGTMYIDKQVIDVPVMVENTMSIGAVSLVLNYASNLEIVGVTVANTQENLNYTARNGQLRIAWFTTDPLSLKAGDVLLTLQVKANTITDKSMNFYSTTESTLADGSAVTIAEANLMMPKLSSLTGVQDYSLSNFPNPFSNTTEIRYSLPQNGNVSIKVYNVLGEEVATVVSAAQNAGNYVVSFDGSKLPKGVYICKLQVNDVTKANSMVITE